MNHLKENKQSYLDHLKFAWIIAFYMFVSSCFFIIHGVFPFAPIPKKFNLERMLQKIKKWYAYRQIRKLK